jgi:Concanavalin A-like lectin/glucanases superfamily
MNRFVAIVAALATLAVTEATASASSGPVGQWRLDEGAGIVATDSSGFGDNGALFGGARWANGPNGGSALTFDGATGRVQVPNAPELEPSAAVSVSAWIERSGSPGTYRYIISKGATGCIAASYALYSGPNGGLQFYVSRSSGTTYARSPDADASVWDGRWHFVVGTFDGTDIRLYVDGTQVGSGTAYPGTLDYKLPESNDLYIGDYPGITHDPECQAKNFLGEIADVQIWDRALSAAEVEAMAQPPQRPALPGQNAPPVAPSQSGGTPGGGGQAVSIPPLLRMLRLSRSTFESHAIGRRLVISYSDSQSAHVKLTILKLTLASRCFTPGKRKAVGRCPRYVTIRHFMHRDHVGRNQVRLPAGLRLFPGIYQLLATPSAHGTTGRTVGVTFKVVR